MKKVHFIGIGGIGLSAIARFLSKQGYIITGSDVKYTPIIHELECEGASVCIGHSEKNITSQDFVIYSAAVKSDNVELIQAKKLNKVVLSRKDALPLVLKNKKVFSVAGAHGKSTTSAMLASIVDGSVIIGAVSKQFGSNMFYKESENVIFEADESDSSFLNSNPYVAIVTNAEPEHMEFYGYDYEKFYKTYEDFLHLAKHCVINAEDEFLGSLKDLKATKLYPSVDIKNIKTSIKNNEPYTTFELKNLGEFEVFGVGDHIALDASLVILASLKEYDVSQIKQKLKNYKGIKKRFDILHANKTYALIDDYAHHPTEIKATLKSAKKYAKKMGFESINVIWQPHKYSRLMDNLQEFKTCFEGINKLVILPVYSAGEEKKDINLYEEFKQYDPIFAKRVFNNNGKINFINEKNQSIIFDKDIVIGFGAGDITYQLRGVI